MCCPQRHERLPPCATASTSGSEPTALFAARCRRVLKCCLHPAAPSEVRRIGLSAVAPVLSRSRSTLPPLFLSVLVSLAPEEREAMLGELLAGRTNITRKEAGVLIFIF